MAILPTAFLAILYTIAVYLFPLYILIADGHIYKKDVEWFFVLYFGSALGWQAAFLLKKFVNYVQTCLTKYQQNRNNILIGLGFITVCSIGGRVVFYDLTKIEKNQFVIDLYIFATTFGSFYFIFVEEAVKKCKWNFEFSGYQFACFCGAVIVNLLAILLPCITALGNKEQKIIIFFQVVLGLIGTTSSIEILMIVMGKFELDGQSDGEELTSVTTGKPKEATGTSSFRNDLVHVM